MGRGFDRGDGVSVAKLDQLYPPQRVAPGIEVRVIRREWLDKGAPFARGPFVTIIVVDEGAKSEDVRRKAIPRALQRRRELAQLQGHSRARSLLDELLNHRLAHGGWRRLSRAKIEQMRGLGVPPVSFGTLAGLVEHLNALLVEAARREINGDKWGHWLLRGWLEAFFGPTRAEELHRKFLDSVRHGPPLRLISATQVRDAVHNWERSEPHKANRAVVKRALDRFVAEPVALSTVLQQLVYAAGRAKKKKVINRHAS